MWGVLPLERGWAMGQRRRTVKKAGVLPLEHGSLGHGSPWSVAPPKALTSAGLSATRRPRLASTGEEEGRVLPLEPDSPWSRTPLKPGAAKIFDLGEALGEPAGVQLAACLVEGFRWRC